MEDIEKKLRKLGVKPVEGQNFLNSEPIIQALVEAGEIEENHSVLEIGPGTGNITEHLVEKADNVYGVEKDTTLAEHLKDKYADEKVEIVNEDFLNYELPEIDRCVSNIPFQISSEIIEILGKNQIQSSLIVQKALAEKAVAEPGESSYGPFTVMANYYFIPVKLRDVSKRRYFPQPEVETSILKLYPNKERHGVKNEDEFFDVTKALFTHKRKKVRNAFVDARHIIDIEKDEAKQIRDDIPHSDIRVVNLDVKKIVDIAEYLAENSILN
jgi:16S rRNA (adenine1518-N6/adenine1519-N6)-dimethyltransferase